MKKLSIFKLELRKSVLNRGFAAAIFIGIVLAALSLVYQVNMYNKQIQITEQYGEDESMERNPDLTGDILFNRWIGGENGSLGSIVYFFIFPVMIVLPYGWSFASETKNGYSKQMIVKTGRMRYLFAKYFALFVSAGLAMIIPMAASLVMTACVFPVRTPFVIDDVEYGVFANSLFAGYYYTNPFVYLALYLLVDFLMCGLIACICITASVFIRQKYVVMVIPMLVCLGIEYVARYIYDSDSYYNYEISLLHYLKPVQSSFPASGMIIMLTGCALIAVTLILPAIWEKKHEIY